MAQYGLADFGVDSDAPLLTRPQMALLMEDVLTWPGGGGGGARSEIVAFQVTTDWIDGKNGFLTPFLTAIALICVFLSVQPDRSFFPHSQLFHSISLPTPLCL
jgi:hypothetical protein